MAIQRLTPQGEHNPIDGYVDHPLRIKALELLGQTLDDLTDEEYLGMGTDEGWYLALCERLGRLPSEVDPYLTAREATLLQAQGIVSTARQQLLSAKRDSQRRLSR